MLTAGAYTVYAFNAGLGWPLLTSAIAGCVVGGIMAVLIDAVVYRRLRDRSGVTLLVASMGVAFVLENAVRFIAGNSPAGYQVDPARPLRVGEHLRINHEQLVVAAVSLVALLAIWALFRLTPLGRAMRAVADNPSLATARGVDANRVIGTTWFIAGVLATAAGTLIGLDATLDPQMGWNYVIQVFAATILGGIAHPMAAVFGALTLGVIAELSTLVLPPHYRPLVAFAVLTMLLLVRPWGVFGTARIAK
jgi:branched-chain amino acid transport system permease protein